MTLFEHMQLQARAGLAEIDRDRDAAVTFEARWGGAPMLDVYLMELARERQLHLVMLQGLEQLRAEAHPALQLPVRATRMAKSILRPAVTTLLAGTGL